MTEQTQDKNALIDELDQNVPDELHPVLQCLVDNLKLILVGVGAIIAVVAAYAGISAYSDYQYEKNANKLGEIMVAKQGKERVEALEAFVAEAPGGMETGARMELAGVLMENGEYAKAAEVFAQVAKGADQDLKTVSVMGQSKAMLLDGKPAEALKLLIGLKAQAPESFKKVITIQTAQAAEQAKDWQTAIGAYQELAQGAEQTEKGYYDAKIEQLQAKM